MQPKAALTALEQLVNSKGWGLVRETMAAEITQAAMNIAKTPSMTQQQVDFQRGAIWAASQLIELPHRLRDRFETDLVLQSANLPTSPAKAGPET